jgi:CheY-like chemotaxis protein/HPt (histidine-containing phosphotransfer) domain-containing protein
MLEAWGIKVESVDSGRRALQELRDAAATAKYDIAVLDMQMPEMDGLELAQHIKADPEIAMTRLIMLSSMGHTRSMPHVERGIEAVLTKPVRQSNLYDALAQLLSKGRVPTETAAAQIETSVPDVSRHKCEISFARVIVAEDNPVNQEIASRMLEKLGCTVEIASDGAEAIRLVLEKEYDAVFMDCFMPVVDGYNATKAIRSREAPGRHVTIVAMTANALEGDRERCLAAGMDDYITKPVKLETLKAALRKWVGAKNTQPVNDTIAVREAEENQCPTLDRARLQTLKELGDEGDSTWLRTIVDIFVKDTAQRLTAFALILDAGDRPALATLTHTLKGSCRNIGALGMTRLCQDIEGALEKGIIESCRTMIDELKNEFVRFRHALEVELPSLQEAL